MSKKRHKRHTIAGILLLAANSAMGVGWEVTKGFDLAVSHSDNLLFSADDDTENQSVINLSPFVELNGTSWRSEFAFIAGGEFQSFPDQSSDSFTPELEATLDITLVENLLSSEISASATQVDSDEEIIFEDTTLLSNNTNDQYFGSVSTNFNHEFGQFGQLQADHTYSVIDNSGDVLSDSFDHTTGFSWEQLFGPGLPGWGLEGRHQRTEFKQLDDSAEVYSLFSGVGLFASREWLVTGGLGREWTQSGDDDEKTVDDIWGLSVAWRPNAQNSLVLGYGKRSFGSNPSLEYTLAGRRATFSAHWRRNYANTRVISINGATANEATTTALVEEEGAAGTPEHLLVDRQLFIDDELGLELSLRGRLSDVVLKGIYLVRGNRVNRTEEENALISVAFNRKLNLYTRWELKYTYREQIASTAVDSIIENRVRLSIRYSK